MAKYGTTEVTTFHNPIKPYGATVTRARIRTARSRGQFLCFWASLWRPFGACPAVHPYPRLTPWAAFLGAASRLGAGRSFAPVDKATELRSGGQASRLSLRGPCRRSLLHGIGFSLAPHP